MRFLAAAAMGMASVLSAASPPSEPEQPAAAISEKQDVLFESGSGRCGGKLVAQWILTARHCADGIASSIANKKQVFVIIGQHRVQYQPKELASLLSASPPNIAREALSLDFALLPAPSQMQRVAAPPDPVPAAELVAKAVRFTTPEGVTRECRVRAVCGAQVEIYCSSENLPQKGTSGSFVYRVPDDAAVGVLTNNYPTANSAILTSYSTILGRSSELASAWNSMRAQPKHSCDLSKPDGRYCAVSAEFARSAKYRYPLEPSRSCRGAAVVQPKLTSTRIRSDLFFTAVAMAGPSHALIADESKGLVCIIGKGDFAVRTCSRLPVAFGRSVRSLISVGTNEFVVSQRATIDGEIERSKILVATLDPLTESLGFSAVVVAPLRQVVAAHRTSSGAIMLGGTGGACVLRATDCTRIMSDEESHAPNWIVRGFVNDPAGGVIAVGRDLWRDEGSDLPARQRIPIARCWKIDEATIPARYVSRCRYPTNTLVERLAQLSSPMLLQGEPIAFASSGEAVSLSAGRIGRLIPFSGLMSSSRPASALDDVIRGAILNSDGTISVASSDGSFRVIRAQPDSAGQVERLVADDTYTAFDLAVWLVDVASEAGWALVVAQSGEAYVLNWPAER